MSKKLDHSNRVYQELRDRYGEDDKHVQSFRAELDVLESIEFMQSTRPIQWQFPSRPYAGISNDDSVVQNLLRF